MNELSSLGHALVAPGLLAKQLNGLGKPGSILFPLVAFVALPSLGFGWILLYTLSSPSSFLLMLQFTADVSIVGTGWNPYVALLVLGGVIALVFWFMPSLFLFVFNIIVPANRKDTGKFFGTRFFSGASYCCGTHLPFLTLAFLLMASRATFFWGMRTIEDITFTIALLISLGIQFTSQVIFSKNYFAKGLLPSLIAVISYVVLLAGVILLLF